MITISIPLYLYTKNFSFDRISYQKKFFFYCIYIVLHMAWSKSGGLKEKYIFVNRMHCIRNDPRFCLFFLLFIAASIQILRAMSVCMCAFAAARSFPIHFAEIMLAVETHSRIYIYIYISTRNSCTPAAYTHTHTYSSYTYSRGRRCRWWWTMHVIMIISIIAIIIIFFIVQQLSIRSVHSVDATLVSKMDCILDWISTRRGCSRYHKTPMR